MRTLTSQAAIEIAQIIRDNHIHGETLSTDSRTIEARLAEAEFQLCEGNPASIEIKARDSVHGVVQDIHLSPACVEDTFKVGYYQGDCQNGITYLGDALEDENIEVCSPFAFQLWLEDADETDVAVTFFDESSRSIFEQVEAEYGIKF